MGVVVRSLTVVGGGGSVDDFWVKRLYFTLIWKSIFSVEQHFQASQNTYKMRQIYFKNFHRNKNGLKELVYYQSRDLKLVDNLKKFLEY